MIHSLFLPKTKNEINDNITKLSEFRKNEILLFACKIGNLFAVKTLLTKDNIESRDLHGCTPLMHAVTWSHYDIIELLIKKGANINNKDISGCTTLIQALHYLNQHHSNQNHRIINILLNAGADIETAYYGISPLIWSSYQGNVVITEILLSRNINIDATDKMGMTALMYASRHGHDKIIKLLIEAGANKEIKNKQGLIWTDFYTEYNRF